MTTTNPRTAVPIRSAAELTDHWTALLDPPIFGSRSLWLMWLQEDGRPLELIIPIEDLPRLPDHSMLFGLLSMHEAVSDARLDGGGHLAMALCRPGRPEITEDDDAWVGRARRGVRRPHRRRLEPAPRRGRHGRRP